MRDCVGSIRRGEAPDLFAPSGETEPRPRVKVHSVV